MRERSWGRQAYLLTYLLTAWRTVLLEKLTGFAASQEIPQFYRTERFITAFTSFRHPSLSWASLVQSIPPQPASWRSIVILSSHLRLGLPNGLFPSGILTKYLYTSLFSPIRATCPAHLILLDFITRKKLGEDYRSLSSSLCTFLHSSTSSLVGPNILFKTLFSNILSQFPPSMWLTKFPTHTTGKIIFLYILIFKFFW